MWICELKHVYESSVSNRTGRSKSGCPYCSGAKVLAGFNDLATTHPKLSKEAYGWDPKTIGRGSALKLKWKCPQQHIYISTPNSRTRVRKVTLKRKSGGTNCPYCVNQKVLAGFNDFASTHPELAKEASGWDPKTIVAGTNKKLGWVCKKNHFWTASVVSRSKLKLGCPVCSNKQVLVGFNDLKTLFPKIAQEAYGWDPTKYVPKSGTKKQWKCTKNHKWTAAIYSRTTRGWGCPYCSNQRLLVGFNDLATTHSEIARQASGWDPKTVTSGDMKKLKWRCEKGHEFYSTVRDRAARNTKCVYCVGKKVLAGFNDLATTHPELAKEASGWDPKTISSGSNNKYKWKCEKGHEWISVVANRTRENSGCPICKNKTLLTGFNDLATTHPDIANQALGWDPSKILFGSGKKLKWRCNLGHEWIAGVVSRTSDHQTGCPTCAKSGFDPNIDAYLYFIEHPIWEMMQIGITNVLDIRIGMHKRKGWNVIEVRGPMEGLLARQWENSILQMLNSNGADLSNDKIAGKFDGYSEAWSKSTFPVKSIKELMRLTEEFEEKKGLRNN